MVLLGRPREDWWDSLCHHNSGPDEGRLDPTFDCGQPARWHVQVEDGDGGTAELQSCDGHLSLARVAGVGLLSMHEFGSACGLERSWWRNEGEGAGSFCITEERGLELGWLEFANE